ncbi:ankyrin repeat domain-containing protein 9 [Puntigrus tetrazona]|uniref:ankyrin repeat domain-containing protein 9 n=1 Tax=Puntigrus tetrazona TaxID=1606681 RepID=UPI001C8AD33A|nr:ankyrin repeat domain-containing protein 9 [Puntigrus tetrazona]
MIAPRGTTLAMEAERERQELVSFLFYQAVRDLKPVWMLEEMRTMERCRWEEDAPRRVYSPSDALLYAIVHDHREYARHLLSCFADEALATPGARFCCRASSAPHLAMAVRYDRRDILALILQATRREQRPRLDTPLRLACELLRADALLLLLGSGASPRAADPSGTTPLDLVLRQLRDSGASVAARSCLEKLLLFLPQPRFAMKSSLLEEPRRWAALLGEDTLRYLTGRAPAPLLLCAMRAILARLPPERFPGSLDTLPIPAALKPR